MKEAQVVSDWNLALKIRMEELGLTKTMTQNQMNPQSETTGSKVQGKKETNLKNVVLPKIGGIQRKETPYRRLTDAKANEKREKGLCFVVMRDTSMVIVAK